MLGVKEKHTIQGWGEVRKWQTDRQTYTLSSNNTCMLVSIHKNIVRGGGCTGTPPPPTHRHTSRIIVMEVVVAEVDDIRELPFLIFNRP